MRGCQNIDKSSLEKWRLIITPHLFLLYRRIFWVAWAFHSLLSKPNVAQRRFFFQFTPGNE